jgi:hypothetical protein
MCHKQRVKPLAPQRASETALGQGSTRANDTYTDIVACLLFTFVQGVAPVAQQPVSVRGGADSSASLCE